MADEVTIYAPGEGDRSVYVACGQSSAEITSRSARQLAAQLLAAADRADDTRNPWVDRG